MILHDRAKYLGAVMQKCAPDVGSFAPVAAVVLPSPRGKGHVRKWLLGWWLPPTSPFQALMRLSGLRAMETVGLASTSPTDRALRASPKDGTTSKIRTML